MLAALELARGGFRVLPCRPGEKVAALKEWQNKATTDEVQIVEWWSKKPYNIAIACGEASGCFVVDVDSYKGGDLHTFFREAGFEGSAARIGIVLTPRGGKHYYYRHPGDGPIAPGTNKVPGVDVRGDGSYSLAPPSVVTEGQYEWAA